MSAKSERDQVAEAGYKVYLYVKLAIGPEACLDLLMMIVIVELAVAHPKSAARIMIGVLADCSSEICAALPALPQEFDLQLYFCLSIAPDFFISLIYRCDSTPIYWFWEMLNNTPDRSFWDILPPPFRHPSHVNIQCFTN